MLTPATLDALRAFGLDDDDGAAWERSGLPAEAFADWLTDRVARAGTAGTWLPGE